MQLSYYTKNLCKDAQTAYTFCINIPTNYIKGNINHFLSKKLYNADYKWVLKILGAFSKNQNVSFVRKMCRSSGILHFWFEICYTYFRKWMKYSFEKLDMKTRLIFLKFVLFSFHFIHRYLNGYILLFSLIVLHFYAILVFWIFCFICKIFCFIVKFVL